jgi:hypothetical protein
VSMWNKFNLIVLLFTVTIPCPFAGAVCSDIHCSLADHVGFCISCVCSTVQCAALSHAVSSSSHIGSPFYSSQPFFGQCYFFDIVCSSSQVLGKRLQHKTRGPFQHSAVLSLGTQSRSGWQQPKFHFLWTSNSLAAAFPVWRFASG